jgi:hypothetical protein
MSFTSPSKELEAIRRELSQLEHPFSCLEAFWMGYQSGYAAAKHGFMSPDYIAPDGFHQFVSEHFGRSWPNAKGWRILIRERTASEREAFDLFFRLRSEFEERHAKVA